MAVINTSKSSSRRINGPFFQGNCRIGYRPGITACFYNDSASLTVEETALILKTPGQTYTFEWIYVVEVKPHPSIEFMGVRFLHTKSILPPYLVFGPKSEDRERLEASLAAHGFTVNVPFWGKGGISMAEFFLNGLRFHRGHNE